MKCPKCHTDLPNDANFCFKCGQRLSLKPQQSDSSPFGAERKRVTALFSDLSGYTAITERLYPEDVTQITSHIFAGIRDIVTRYEGFIEKFIGDAAMADFGSPQSMR